MPDEGTAVEEKDVSTEEMSEEEKLMAKLQEALSVDAQEIGPLRKKLTITIPRATIDERLQGQMWVTVVATGYGDRQVRRERRPAAQEPSRIPADTEPRVHRTQRQANTLGDLRIPEYVPPSR